VLASQLPSYVDDVLEFDSLSDFPTVGEDGKIYVTLDTNLTYRWTGSDYIEISKSLALGETASTAYRGDRGKIAYDHSQTSGNPHNTQIGDIPNLQSTLDSKVNLNGSNATGSLLEAIQWRHQHLNKAYLDTINQNLSKDSDVQFGSIKTDLIISPSYTSGLLGSGYRLSKDTNNNYSLEIDNITVRKELNVKELNVDKITASNGAIWVTD